MNTEPQTSITQTYQYLYVICDGDITLRRGKTFGRGAKCQSVASALRENLQQIIDVNKLGLNRRLARYRHRRFRLTQVN